MDASSQFQDSLPIHPDALLAHIEALNLSYESFSHPPLRTVADSKEYRAGFLSKDEGGAHIKNLYLRDRKKQNFLAVIEEDKDVDLKALSDKLGAGRLSFGSADRLLEFCGVRPGAVTPLAMLFAHEKNVTLAIDDEILKAKLIYMHPLVNDRTIAMTPDDLRTFLSSFGVTPLPLSLS